MAETFLIKKTAFSDKGTTAERASNSFVIGPGELNGPGGSTRNSDLKLYGYGAPKWGEGINQNIYRILENNACPQKELGDYNPRTGLYDYDPSVDPLLPKDEFDLGIGNGITYPVVGQNWFNTTNELMYTYTLTNGWSSAGEGTTLFGELNMSNNKITQVGLPTDPGDAVPLGFADARYLNVSGDSMAGTLDMSNNRISNLADPLFPSDAISAAYADLIYMKYSGGTLTGDITFAIPTPINESNGIRWSGNTDSARIFVEGYAGTESSRLVFYMADNTSAQDYIEFRLNNGGLNSSVLELFYDSIQVNVLENHNNNDIINVNNILGNTATFSNQVSTNNAIISGTLYLDSTDARIYGGVTGTDTYLRIYTNTERSFIFYCQNRAAFAINGDTNGPFQVDSYVDMDMNFKRITRLPVPVFGSEAVNKDYVDRKIAVLSGTISHGGTIPLPAGFTQSQCKWIAAAGQWNDFGGYGRDGIDRFYAYADVNRLVRCYTTNGPTFTGTANYIIIGIK